VTVDVVFQVNGADLSNATHCQAVTLLGCLPGPVCRLKVYREPLESDVTARPAASFSDGKSCCCCSCCWRSHQAVLPVRLICSETWRE